MSLRPLCKGCPTLTGEDCLHQHWGKSAEEVSRQLEVVKSEAVQDKRLIHYLQQEVATLKAIEDVKVKDLGYIVNTESGVVHRPVVWAKDVVPMHWRTACGWAFGFSQYDVSSVSPVGAVFCRGCSGQRNKAISRSEAPSNSSNSSVPFDSSKLFLPAELRSAIGSASVQQL